MKKLLNFLFLILIVPLKHEISLRDFDFEAASSYLLEKNLSEDTGFR